MSDTSRQLLDQRIASLRRQIGDQQTRAAGLEASITELQGTADALNAELVIEEARTGIADPDSTAYSLRAKSLRTRRDNCQKSIAGLKWQHLTVTEGLKPLQEDLHRNLQRQQRAEKRQTG